MKKFSLFITILAAVSMIACQKEQEKEIEPVNEPEKEVVLTTISATAGDVATKAYVDGLQVKWSAADVIAVANEDDDIVEFTLNGGENTASATFSGDLSGKALGTYAVFPNTANAAVVSNTATVDYKASWEYGKSEVPMYGVNDGAGSYTFNNIGGAIQVTYSNIPATTLGKYFKITETHTGGEAKYITGAVNISNLDSTPAFDFSSLNGQEVTVNSIDKDATEVTLVVPVPTGTGFNYQVALYEVGASSPIPGSVKNASNKTINANKIMRFPSIDLKAAKNEVLWSESFDGLSNNDQPIEATVAGFKGVKPSYAYDGEYTKIYASSGALDSAPELLIAKSSRSETWVVTNIPTGSWESLTLTYKANQDLSVSSSDVTVGDASYEAITGTYGTYTRVITDAGSVASFSLTFAMTSDQNARIDDIVLTAGVPEPSISVTTTAATSIASATGTTATVNGTITLVNGAVIGDVDEAGFYYKLTSAGSFTKVTLDSAPTTASFSYDLTSLTKDAEYTFYAYAIYNGGSEVTGEQLTFTPIKSNEYEYIFTSKAWAATLGGSVANWDSGKDGNALTSGRGIQVTTGVTGANATSPTSFTNVSKVVVTYSTNASNGAGSISIKVGSGTAKSQDVTKTGGTTDRTLTYTFSPKESGKVNISVTCTTNSIYVKSVTISAD